MTKSAMYIFYPLIKTISLNPVKLHEVLLWVASASDFRNLADAEKPPHPVETSEV
jgi:hypothetical protein